jgi:hypothetical protein
MNEPIPKNILDAAILVGNYFEERGIKNWQLVGVMDASSQVAIDQFIVGLTKDAIDLEISSRNYSLTPEAVDVYKFSSKLCCSILKQLENCGLKASFETEKLLQPQK